jgi:hypothetical protein
MSAQSRPGPTVISIPKGSVLSDEDIFQMLEGAVETHCYKELQQHEPAVRKRLVAAMAVELFNQMQRCGKSHLAADITRQVQILPPDTEECRDIEASFNQIVLFREYTQKEKLNPGEGKLFETIRKPVGRIWDRIIHQLLGYNFAQ